MKRRRFGAVAVLTTAAGGLHAHHHCCTAFRFPARTSCSISIRRRASVHPVSSAAGDGSRTFKRRPCENNRTPMARESSIRQSHPTTAIRPNPCSSATSLSAFWARGTDALPADDSKRDGSSFLRRILPPRANNSNSEKSVSSTSTARTAAADGRKSSAATATTTTTSAASTQTPPKAPTARYYYVSPASLHEQCPSWTPGSAIDAEECPLDDSLFVGAYEISEHLERAQGLDVKRAGMNSAVSQENEDDGRQQQEEQQQQKAASRLVEEALHGFIHRHALHTMNLKIKSDATSRSAVLLRGELGSVQATFDRLSFPSLKLSGGGTITATGLNLNTASFVPALGRFVRRWSNPFTLQATDCVLTQEDLRTSRCIRLGLANLGNRILRTVVASDNSLDVVRIDRGARLSVSTIEVTDHAQLQIRGVVTTILGSTLPFAVRTGLQVARGGHVLQFPGLRVVLNPGPLQTIVPLHLVHKVELDLGDRASIGKVEIDGRRKQIRLSATVSVTPRGSSSSSSGSAAATARGRRGGNAVGGAAVAIVKRAKYACDVGRWLTNLSFTT